MDRIGRIYLSLHEKWRFNGETLTSPCITAITQQEAILTVAGPTHLTVCLLQVRIYRFLLTFLHRLLHSDLNKAMRKREETTNKLVWTAQRFSDRVHKGDLKKNKWNLGLPMKERCKYLHSWMNFKIILLACKHNCRFSGHFGCVRQLRMTDACEQCLRLLERRHTHHLFHFPTKTHPQVNVIEGESIYRTRVCILEKDKG